MMGRLSDDRVTFAEYAGKWLLNEKKQSVRGNTYEGTYRNCVEKHLIPYFGKFAIASVRKADIQKFLNGKVFLSESMLQKLRLTLNQIFEDACDNEVIYKNPCKHIQLPLSKQHPKNIEPYTVEEVQTLLEYSKSHQFGLSVLILLKCGLRRSELLGLRWQDVDLENSLIHVTQAVTEVRGKAICGAPKSKTSARTLPLDQELKEILECQPRIRAVHKGRGKNRVSITIKNQFVISDSNGNAMRPTNWEKRVYYRFMEDFHQKYPGIPILKPHGLRHTYGSRLYNNGHGMDIYTIQKLMGHSSIEVTTGVYVKYDKDFLQLLLYKAGDK